MKTFIKFFFISLILSFSISLAAFKPSRVTCIAPASPGGGWDFTCRTPAAVVMKKLKLVPGTMKVVNMSGAGGAVAYGFVVNKRKGDNNLIVAASQATAVRLAQNAYTGLNAAEVNWLGAIGADYGVIAVGKNSRYRNINDLVKAIEQNPSRIKISGGSAVGGWDHMKVLLLAQAGGVNVNDLKKINYVSFESGGVAMIELIGGRVDAFTGDTSEVIAQLEAGNIRILAVLSPEPVKKLGRARTARQQGLDVIGANWRGFYAPQGISEAALKYWQDAVKQVAGSKEWATLRDKNGLAPFSSFGSDFENFLSTQISNIKQISTELGLLKK